MTSSRLPGKVLKPILDKPVLELMVERLKRVPSLDDIILATTSNEDDNPAVELAERLGIKYYRGSEDDVMLRVLGAAQHHQVDVIVETLGDCPLIDPELIEQAIQAWKVNDVDHVCNFRPYTYPIGMEVEVFGTKVLEDAARRTDDPYHHEHVTTFIWENPDIYRLMNVEGSAELTAPDIHITLDTADDFELIKLIFETLYPQNPEFGLGEILSLLKSRPDFLQLVEKVERNVF
ncbi:glycosyltransferase family protein [Magnetovibrio sp. PR-2]|uniref:glycosyltransferase family protein n=1 Tax=Magnetovibrio sp. PR-2 TaxID=3120356 RepID=UPI002FCE00CC